MTTKLKTKTKTLIKRGSMKKCAYMTINFVLTFTVILFYLSFFVFD